MSEWICLTKWLVEGKLNDTFGKLDELKDALDKVDE